MSETTGGLLEPSSWDVAASRQDLAGRLEAARRLPGCPKGPDSALLELSLPPYFTACPNPYLREWLERSGSGGDSRDGADPGPFTTDVSEGKGNLFYKAHSYPTKVPHPAIMRFILHYTEPGDVVLDGFCGTGMTGVAAQACGQPDPKARRSIETEMGKVRWGYRRAVLADLSPSATFIAAGLNLPIDAERFAARSAEILEDFEAEWGWMYRTTDGKGVEHPLEYVVWSEVFTCPTCAGAVVFYDAAFDATTGRVRDAFLCPACGRELDKDKVERRKVPVRTLAGDTIDRVEFRPVAIHYRIGKGKYTKTPDEADRALLRKIAGVRLPGPVPTGALPFMHMTHERAPLPAKGFTHVHHFWGDRALVSLSALWKACSAEPDPLTRTALLFWVEQALWGLSWMNRYVPVHYSHLNQFLNGVYYIPSLHAEYAPWANLEGAIPERGKRQALYKMWRASPAKADKVIISTGSSTRLDLPNASVDYIFVDPPFGSNIYYADLALLAESWHGVLTDSCEEAIVNQSRRVPRTLDQYAALMQRCFAEFYRVLKPGRWMTVEFSNSSNDVWLAIQGALSKVGFVVADTRIIDKQQLSYRQVTAANAVKRDLIISAYKASDELGERLAPVAGTPESAWEFVREHLRHVPVTQRAGGALTIVRERFGDRLYERMIAFHVHQGLAVPVSTAEFYAGLEQRFPERDSMFFLLEQVEVYERQRLSFKELAEAELFITNESSAVQWLRRFLKSKRNPQPYDRIQPAYFQELQVGLPDWEAMPELKKLLEENFLNDEAGRWYLPDPRRGTDLEKLRTRALLKEFDTYLAGRGTLTRFRLEAVRAGFSAAWDRRDYHPIIRVGERLPPDAFVEDTTLVMYVDNARQLAG